MIKHNQKILIPLIVSFLLVFKSFYGLSQSHTNLKINEILILNENGITNEKAQHAPWIEIFNSAYNSVNIGGFYITDDPNNLKKYLIPKNSQKTIIPKRGYIILWADGDLSQGVLHTSFKLDTSSHFLALVEPNGRKIIDSLTLPKFQPDISYSRKNDGENIWEYKVNVSPGMANSTSNEPSAAQTFIQYDPTGIGMAIIAITVIFIVLILLYIVFNNISKLYSLDMKKKKLIKKGKIEEASVIKGDTTGEVSAAIAMALHLYSEQLHDEENAVLTIKRVSKNYSPWNSKIYGIRQFDRKIW